MRIAPKKCDVMPDGDGRALADRERRAEPARGEHAGEQLGERAHPVPLVAAVVGAEAPERQQRARVAHRGIVGRVAVRVDGPARLEPQALALVHFELAVGHGRRREVEHERGLVAGRDRERERVGALHLVAAERRHREVRGVRRADADHVVRQRHHRVVAGDAVVVRVAHGGERDAALARLLDRARHRVVRRGMAQAVARVEQQRRRRVAHGLVMRVGGDAAVADAVDVEPAQPRDAVRLDAAPVGRDEHVADDARLFRARRRRS